MKRYIAALSIIATGCAAPIAFSKASSEARDRCHTDGFPTRTSGPVKLGQFILMGQVEDPGTTGGKLQPRVSFHFFGGGLEDWLIRGGLPQVDMYIDDPNIEPNQNNLFGPKIGDQAGVYRFTHLSPDAAECRAYSAPPTFSDHPIHLQIARLGDGSCAKMSFVGGLDLTHYDSIQIFYSDVTARRRGYVRHVDQILMGGAVVAQSVRYILPDGRPACAGQGQLVDILR